MTAQVLNIGGRRFSRPWALRRLATLKRLDREARLRILAALPPPAVRALFDEWWWQAHGGQIEPPAGEDGRDWRIWAIVAGRGFGKTRAGAEWVWQRARDHPGARIALVAASLDEAAAVMIEGESGLIECARGGEEPRWIASKRTLIFPSGARAFAYPAEKADKLRGPQHHFAWCDEIAKWRSGGTAFDNLLMGLRLGAAPRTIVTTTPKPVAFLKRILALPRCVTTHGRSDENPHSAEDFRGAMREIYAGTRLGRQELDGLMFDDPEGGLWTRGILDGARLMGAIPAMTRVVIGVDPPASATGDACGIVVCGMGADGIAYVLADVTVAGLRPEGWARRAAAAAADWGAQLVVAEKNQGGDMVESVLRGVDSALPVRLVSATSSKAARAEPVALRFETGKARLAGRFAALEDELCAITYAGYEGEGSPDRADAMVWAMSELLKPAGMPRVRAL